jgi:hypothetical protein
VLTQAEARAAVERHGGIANAARAIGVHRTTFTHWLDPEKGRANARRWYQKNGDYQREKSRKQYWEMSGLKLAERRLQIRRIKALKRLEARRG